MAEPKLTKPQRELLLGIVHHPRMYVADYYPPLRRLLVLGLVRDDGRARYVATDAGREVARG